MRLQGLEGVCELCNFPKSRLPAEPWVSATTAVPRSILAYIDDNGCAYQVMEGLLAAAGEIRDRSSLGCCFSYRSTYALYDQ